MCLTAVSRYGTSNDCVPALGGSSARADGARHNTASAAQDQSGFIEDLQRGDSQGNAAVGPPEGLYHVAKGERGASAP